MQSPILPTDERKFTGCIKRRFTRTNQRRFQVAIKSIRYYRTHTSYREAFDDLVVQNQGRGLPIKNKIHVFADFYEMELGKVTTLVSRNRRNLELLQKNIWHFNGRYVINSDGEKLHNLIKDFDPSESENTIDHINNNTLDNRNKNLREASSRIQKINRRRMKNNKSGYVGVSFCRANLCYRARWNDEDGGVITKSFSINKFGDDVAFAKAIEAREKGIRTQPDYVKALNLK